MSGNTWISMDDLHPGKDQPVFYYAPMIGVWRGKFDPIGFTFYGSGGFIDGYDVTHWMPQAGQEDKPKAP